MFTALYNIIVTAYTKMPFCSSVLTVLLGICFSTSFGADSPESRANATTNLVRGILKHYEASTEPFLLPLQENLGPLEVNISWLPTNILKFYESDQYIELRGYISLSWHDLNLKWTSYNNGIDNVDIPGEKFWTPKLVLYESQSYDYASVFYENRMTTVNHNGVVVWKSDVTTSTFCQVFQETFPYDHQACKLTFTSAMRYQTLIKFSRTSLSTNKPSVTVTNGAWEVKRVIVPDCTKMEKLRNRTAVRFVVELKRKLQRYYLVTLVVPCFILSLFTSLVFLLPTDSDKRMDLAMMNVLTLFVYQGLIDSIGPRTGSSYLSTFALITIFEATATTVFEILKQQVKKNYPPHDSTMTMKKILKSIIPYQEPTKKRCQKPTNDDQSNDGQTNDNQQADEKQNVKVTRRFDKIIGLTLFTVKCTVFITFGILLILAEKSPTDIIKCRNEYYFEE